MSAAAVIQAGVFSLAMALLLYRTTNHPLSKAMSQDPILEVNNTEGWQIYPKNYGVYLWQSPKKTLVILI